MSGPLTEIQHRLMRSASLYLENLQDDEMVGITASDVARNAFLGLANKDDVEGYNNRCIYLELVTAPTLEDIMEYCQIQCLNAWASSPSGGFYRKDKQTGEISEERSYSEEEVGLDFKAEVLRLRPRMENFASETTPVIRAALLDKELNDGQIINRMFEIRKQHEIPVKDRAMKDRNGRILKFGYSQQTYFTGDSLRILKIIATARGTVV